MLLWSKRWFEARGFTVLYGDTDSLFVRSGMDDAEQAAARGPELARALNERARALHRGALARAEPAGAEVREAVSEAVPAAARHSTRGASKRYAGLRQRQRRSMPSSSSAWKSCVATGPRSPSKCSASCTSACSPIKPSTCISPTSSAGARRRAGRRARLSQEPAQGHRGVHGDDAAARRRGAQVDAAARPADQLRHHDCRPRAARQRAASARPRALRRSSRSSRSRSRCWRRWAWTSSR